MTHEIPPSLAAYHPGVGHYCEGCGRLVVEAVETPGAPFRCGDCQAKEAAEPFLVDDLTRAALEDRGPLDLPDDHPTVWRFVAVVAFAVVALGIVFWKR